MFLLEINALPVFADASLKSKETPMICPCYVRGVLRGQTCLLQIDEISSERQERNESLDYDNFQKEYITSSNYAKVFLPVSSCYNASHHCSVCLIII